MNIRGYVPVVNREWFSLLRRLMGYSSISAVADKTGLSYATIYSLESGVKSRAKSVSEKTITIVANTLGIKKSLFFYRTDEQGRITSLENAREIIKVFMQMGYKDIILSPDVVPYIFSDEISNLLLADTDRV